MAERVAGALKPVGLGHGAAENLDVRCARRKAGITTQVDERGFQVSLIPTTLALTTLGRKQVGALVNLEVDVIAKYVEKLVGVRG